jgi:uncharacterized protein YccT (UPF0319 family)
VSSSLLRGADSIELDNGPHQLVFRVEKSIGLANHEQRLYISPPLIISFNTRQISQVNITLPRLETEKESAAFDASPRIELLDGDAMPIPVKLDILALTTSPKGPDYEAATQVYNKAGKRASLPQFATLMADDSTLLSGVSELDVIPSVPDADGTAPEILVPAGRSRHAGPIFTVGKATTFILSHIFSPEACSVRRFPSSCSQLT